MRVRAFMAGLATVGLLAGCGGLEAQTSGSIGDAKPGSAAIAGAKEKLEKLTVKGRAPKTGFDRDKFGPAWADVDRNGCDTRNDILKRDMEDEKIGRAHV